MYETHPFEHNGKQYEVRPASDGKTIYIRAFLDGKPANGYTYSVELLTVINAHTDALSIDPVRVLIDAAVNDVKNGRWEQYVAAAKASQNQDRA